VKRDADPPIACGVAARFRGNPKWLRILVAAAGAVRGVPLPAHPGWDSDISVERRSLDSDAVPEKFEQALVGIAKLVYGIDAFRPGQVRAIRRVLAGGDSCVLLPTGAGKTLIFQTALLARSTVTRSVSWSADHRDGQSAMDSTSSQTWGDSVFPPRLP
jgi:hypothetical protein